MSNRSDVDMAAASRGGGGGGEGHLGPLVLGGQLLEALLGTVEEEVVAEEGDEQPEGHGEAGGVVAAPQDVVVAAYALGQPLEVVTVGSQAQPAKLAFSLPLSLDVQHVAPNDLQLTLVVSQLFLPLFVLLVIRVGLSVVGFVVLDSGHESHGFVVVAV